MTLTPWITRNQLGERVDNIPQSDVDTACQMATEVLFKLSGEQFGQRRDVVRPHRLAPDCDCGMGAKQVGWGFPSGGYMGGIGGIGSWWYGAYPAGWGCACSSSQLVLPRASAINAVTVDGVSLDPGLYTLYGGRRLVRMVDPATGRGGAWPCCQLLEQPLGQSGTWSIDYTHGRAPVESAVLAAKELAIQLALAFGGDKDCKLPARVTQVARQGVSIAIADDFNFLKLGKTGLYAVDLFLAAYNPDRLRRRSRVASVDSGNLATVPPAPSP